MLLAKKVHNIIEIIHFIVNFNVIGVIMLQFLAKPLSCSLNCVKII